MFKAINPWPCGTSKQRLVNNYIQFFLYKFLPIIKRGALSITVIIVGNRFDDPSSNPRRGYLCLTSH